MTPKPNIRPLEEGERLLFHVFADGIDGFYKEHEFDRANQRFDELAAEHYNVRLYWEIEEEATGDTIEEDSIRWQGDYPA